MKAQGQGPRVLCVQGRGQLCQKRGPSLWKVRKRQLLGGLGLFGITLFTSDGVHRFRPSLSEANLQNCAASTWTFNFVSQRPPEDLKACRWSQSRHARPTVKTLCPSARARHGQDLEAMKPPSRTIKKPACLHTRAERRSRAVRRQHGGRDQSLSESLAKKS